ncbi:MAG: aminotransferase class I/II-fold pyridoxal phosphate-dependent enzyme, partial [Nitrospiraceae bacterium]|nr:aminotransferase class I/II-fold pyridoxal phosphate-dependent enzyme [Nitrospiraceae bacterium]
MSLSGALLSEYGALSCVPSPVNRMMAAFAGDFRDGCDINLGVGYVNERTIPDQRLFEAFDYVRTHPEEHRQAFNYGGPTGSRRLIDAIINFHSTHRIGGLTRDILATKTTLIGPSGATSILDALSDVLKPGIVITSDPMYYIYCDALERKGFEVITVPEDAHGIDADAVRAKLDALGDRQAGIAFVYIVTVSNPTSSILSNPRREALVEIVSGLSRRLGRKVPLILDKAYEFLIHDPAVEPPISGFLFDDAGIVYEIGTLSKILAPALRIGYLMGPDGGLVQALTQRTSDVGFSAPLLNQEIAAYLIDHHVDEQLRRVNEGYRAKALQTRRWIDERLGDALEDCVGGQAGFYFYLTFRDVATTEQSRFFHFLARTTGDPDLDGPPGAQHPRVIYIPGEYCVHPKGDRAEQGTCQLRLSYGFEEPARIGEALALMQQAVAYARS